MFIIPVGVVVAVGFILFANSLGQCLRMFPSMAGTAAVLMGFLTRGEGALAGYICALISTSITSLSIVIFVSLAGVSYGFYLLKKHKDCEIIKPV